MKHIIITMTFCFAISTAIFSQKISSGDLPKEVKDAFKTQFSIAEKVVWNLDYDKYKAEFIVGKSDFAATFNKEGKWLKTETFLKSSDLPKAIRDTLLREFGELRLYKIEDVEKVETADKIVYEMEVEKGELHYAITASEKGNLLKKEEVTENKAE